jgi:hypothetical protein
MDKLLHTETFNLAPHENGGESLLLHIEYFDNGDHNYHGIYMNQTLSLQSYGNSASFNLCGAALSPEILRKLADTIERGHALSALNFFEKVEK